MLKQIINIWRNNNGTLLFVCGLAVVTVMSILWRFDMIPDIGQSLRVSPVLIGGRVTTMPNIVVVTVTSDDYPDAEVHVQVYAAPDLDGEFVSPIQSQTTKLQHGLSEFLLMGLPRGAYFGIAYVDTNSNGQTDQAEDKSAAEPYGTAKASTPSDSHSLPKGVFEVTGEPTFIKIHLMKPKFPVAPPRHSEDTH